jgi:Domain of unknown function (DUF4157)
MWFLNPVGGQLAGSIDQARTRARNAGCDAAPDDIVQAISQFMPLSVFDGVCWTVARPGLTLDSLAINDGGMAAITLVDTIVFRDVNSAHVPDLWAHELIHVCRSFTFWIDIKQDEIDYLAPPYLCAFVDGPNAIPHIVYY